MQDFTNKSDINWIDNISNIDKQLYMKYKFSQTEINYIETKIKAVD